MQLSRLPNALVEVVEPRRFDQLEGLCLQREAEVGLDDDDGGAGNSVVGDEVAPPGAPTIHIRLVSIMGGSGVARGRKQSREERRRERELRKAQRRGLGP